jgi:geranylgeranyl pyrophosphate synthase
VGPGAQAAAILDANHLKTGALFVAAVDMAGVIARADARRLDGLRLFAVHLGQAFQLLDDLADGPGGAGATEIDGKATLLLLLGRDETRRTLARHLEQAFAPLKREGELARFVSELFEARGAGPVSSNGSPRSDA